MANEVPVASVETAKDFGKGRLGEASRWIAEVAFARKAMDDWKQKSVKILQRYADERGTLSGQTDDSRRFNMLWSNIQTLGPAIYAQTPKPVVQRRYLDGDPVARAACTILERAIQTNVTELDDFDDALKQARFDYLSVGRGTTWLRYEPHFGTVQMPGGVAPSSHMGADQPDDLGVSVTNDGQAEAQEITWEEVRTDYVHYSDFLHSPARVWSEVRWVGKQVYMTRDEMHERFGAVADDVPLDWRPMNDDKSKDDETAELFKRAIVVEIWDRPSRKVLWLAPGYGDRLLDKRDDPLGLKDFFPCPKPVFATLTNDSCIPIPDYTLYQDQATLVDDLTGRIAKISEAIKVAGAYDESCTGLQRIMNEGTENQLIPIQNWAGFASAGGFNGSMQFLPIDMMSKVLGELAQVREGVKQDAYEVTGMSDILRGATNPEETATAQNIKSHFATLRLSDRQKEMARFCRDNIRIAGEIIAKHFSPQTLLLLSDYQQSLDANPQMAQQAIALLKQDADRGFRIDIETDSTIADDEQEAQQTRVMFLQALGGFLQQALPVIQNYPPMAPMLGKMILFGVRGFPVGAQLETALEDAINQLESAAAQGQHPQAAGDGAPGQDNPQPGTPAHAEAMGNAANAQAQAAATQAADQGAQQAAMLKNQLTQAQIADLNDKIQERHAGLQMRIQEHQAGLQMKAQQMQHAEQEHQQQLSLRAAESLARTAAASQHETRQ